MSLSSFNSYALSRSEMKNVTGGCGVKCNGTYGWSKSEAKGKLGSGECTNWCCSSC
jgi:natural product precursor